MDRIADETARHRRRWPVAWMEEHEHPALFMDPISKAEIHHRGAQSKHLRTCVSLWFISFIMLTTLSVTHAGRRAHLS